MRGCGSLQGQQHTAWQRDWQLSRAFMRPGASMCCRLQSVDFGPGAMPQPLICCSRLFFQCAQQFSLKCCNSLVDIPVAPRLRCSKKRFGMANIWHALRSGALQSSPAANVCYLALRPVMAGGVAPHRHDHQPWMLCLLYQVPSISQLARTCQMVVCCALQEEVSHCAAATKWLRWLFENPGSCQAPLVDEPRIESNASKQSASSVAEGATDGAGIACATASKSSVPSILPDQYPDVQSWFQALVKANFIGKLKVKIILRSTAIYAAEASKS